MRASNRKKTARPRFDAKAFLNSLGVARKALTYEPARAIYTQGDAADAVFYIQQGSVKLSVLSHSGREAVIGVLGPGDFSAKGRLPASPGVSRRR